MATTSSLEVRDAVAKFNSYEEYLSAQVTPLDLFYLEDDDVARALVELGYRGGGDVLKRAEFELRQRADREKHLHKDAAPRPLASMGRDLSGRPLLQALAAREEALRSGRLTLIAFLRATNAKGQEVSGYVDVGHRMRMEPFEPVFDGKRPLLPTPADLSFFNWETQAASINHSPNFQVISDVESGLLFKNKRDR
jgi:hypothetical protein